MSTLSGRGSERWAGYFLDCCKEITSGPKESESRGKIEEGTKSPFDVKGVIQGSCVLTALLFLLLLLQTEVARADRYCTSSWMSGGTNSVKTLGILTRLQLSVVKLAVTVTRFSPPPTPTTTLTSSPPFTRMVTKLACFSPNILSCVPYLLTSLHITTSTAIRAVDDNQSCS